MSEDENYKEIILQTEPDGRIRYMNETGRQIFNLPAREAGPLSIQDLSFCIIDYPEFELAFRKSLNFTLHQKVRLKIKSGEYIYDYDCLIFALPDQDQSNLYINCIFTDQTEYSTIQNELKKLKHIIEHSTNSIIITDREGKIEYVNRKTEETTGYSLDDLVHQRTNLFKSGQTTPEEYHQLWSTILSGRIWKGYLVNRKKNGDLFHEYCIISPIKNEEDQIINFLAIKEDVTKEVMIREELRSNQERLDLLLATTQVTTWYWDLIKNRIWWDEQGEILTGVGSIENNEHALEVLCTMILPEDISRLNEEIEKQLGSSGLLDINFRIITPRGIIRHLHSRGKIRRDQRQKAIGVTGITIDLSRIREIEESLRRRNEELNQFVYKVSHDLRAPLASIRGIIELERLESNSKVGLKHIRLIEDRVARLDQFIRQILSHSRNLNTEILHQKIDLKMILEKCFKEIDYMKNALEVKKIYKISSGVFFSDEIRIYEIMRNLASNAVKYMDINKSDPHIKITMEADEKEGRIIFEDNGIGIDEKFIDKIFDMFYRASEKSDGSGLGLYIVKQSVIKLGGTISVTSQKGIGTRFMISLPNHIMDKSKIST